MSKTKEIQIAIDGLSASGKGTVARAVAEKLGIPHVCTGYLFRAITLFLLKNNVPIEQVAICACLQTNKFEMKIIEGKTKTFINGEEIDKELGLPEVAKYVHLVAQFECVFNLTTQIMRSLGENFAGIVIEGRRVALDYLPNAPIKIFLTGDVKVRAHRRYLDYVNRGKEITFEEVLEKIEERDNLDKTRQFGPVVMDTGAIKIDTTELKKEEVVAKVMEIIDGYQSSNN